jgi:UDP-galactopyranose mutase
MQPTSISQPTIVCLAHLSWEHVWQRPQHILSRLARHYPVLYINEPFPVETVEAPELRLVAQTNNLTAWQPLFPNRAEVLNRWREVYLELVGNQLFGRNPAHQNGRLVGPQPLIFWFYTPVPYYFLDHFPADLVVYDVMDQLANFKGAAQDLPEREEQLLAQADVVFTGGRSLYESRRHRHPNVHLFASGVEAAHFAQAFAPETAVAPEIAGLPRPVLGYTGVIDERLDLALIDQVASQHPEWHIVMVGPVAKIEESELPRRPNIHYLGQQPYQRLPALLKGFDVCLMPFALNEATRYISPTKTLEYMAARKPIVSTPVPDVAANWSDAVAIAGSPAAFIAAVEQSLNEGVAEQNRRLARAQAYVAANSWDRIAADMRALLEEALAERQAKSMERGAKSVERNANY